MAKKVQIVVSVEKQDDQNYHLQVGDQLFFIGADSLLDALLDNEAGDGYDVGINTEALIEELSS